MDLEEKLKQKYFDLLPIYERCCYNIKDALTIFLSEKNISFLAITSRVKDFNSFFEKVERKSYSNPFNDNEDFCGVRVILYHLNDIKKVEELINVEFDVQLSENKSDKLDINEFGYRSNHFVVKFKKEWTKTPNYRGLDNIKIEIQVRTILMHAWAEIEHKLGYKNKEQIPQKLERKLFMISAKLEEADDQFQELKSNIDSYKENLIAESNQMGKFLGKELNLNTFQALLDFYFPYQKKNIRHAANVLFEIQKYNLSFETLIEYTEKIKPYVGFIESSIYSNTSTQSNIISYAIEAYYEHADLSRASNSRRRVINDLKSMS